MKKIFCFAVFLYSLSGFAQSTYPIRADKVLIEKVGGSAELVLKNATRDSLHGILVNTGSGQTAFAKVRLLNDSTLIIAYDTIKIKGAYAKPITDASKFIDNTTEVIIDTSFTSTCGQSINDYTKIIFPEMVGQQRVRVFANDRAFDSCEFGLFYTWEYATGTLRFFPAYHFSDSSAARVFIEAY